MRLLVAEARAPLEGDILIPSGNAGGRGPLRSVTLMRRGARVGSGSDCRRGGPFSRSSSVPASRS